MSAAAGATVLVTPRSYREADAEALAELRAAVGEVRFNDRGRPLTSAELAAELGDVDGVIAGLDDFDAAAIDAAPRLRVIARYGVGTDNVDLWAAERAGVVVTNTPDANANAVAELAIALMFALLRRLPEQQRRVRDGRWTPARGFELAGSTVGVVGLGRIGAQVARAAAALGARVLAHDPYRDAAFAAEHGAQLVSFEELCSRSRVLSLHAPLTADTRGLVDADALARLPEGAVLVNTARGELIVEADLLDALERGRLAGAALDALHAEPPPPDHPLLGRDDVIVTPHAGAQTEQARRAMARTATAELLRVLRGEAPRHPVRARAEEGAA
jgi:phosphoglycerate dehydrogenase-like enzyme